MKTQGSSANQPKLDFLDELNTVEKRFMTPDIKKARATVDKIAMLLFGCKGDFVKDKKRSSDPKYYGIHNKEATGIKCDQVKPLVLTFDNSTDSGEFEINSLAKLKIKKGSKTDSAIKKLYTKHKVNSVKKTNYIVDDGTAVLREVHLGKTPEAPALALVKELLGIIESHKIDESVEPEEILEGLTRPDTCPIVMRVLKPIFLGKKAGGHSSWTSDGAEEHDKKHNLKKGMYLLYSHSTESTLFYLISSPGTKMHDFRYEEFHPNEIEDLLEEDALKKLGG